MSTDDYDSSLDQGTLIDVLSLAGGVTIWLIIASSIAF
jgi:hypothetical protein